MQIGDGTEPTIQDDMVRIPNQMAITQNREDALSKLIQETFLHIESHGWHASYMVERAKLTPINDDVEKLNDIIIDQFPRDHHNLVLFDDVEGDSNNLYQQEYLSSILPSGLVLNTKLRFSLSKQYYPSHSKLIF